MSEAIRLTIKQLSNMLNTNLTYGQIITHNSTGRKIQVVELLLYNSRTGEYEANKDGNIVNGIDIDKDIEVYILKRTILNCYN
jgi:hypothetical protein